MRIERLNNCCGSRGNLSAVDFQPHSKLNDTQRIATSGGTYVQIWSLSKNEDKISTIQIKCVLLFTFKEHSPYDVTTIRWSPNGQYLASTDSGGITNILKRNEKKTKVMESIIKSKLSGEPPEIPEIYTETSQIKKYTIKYDGTDINKKNNIGIQRISLNSKNVQVESKEIKADNLNILNYDNLEGNLESWEILTTISCPNNMGQLFDISWAPDNRSIIGGGMNGHVIVFDIYTKEIVAKFDALENIQDSSSGRGYIKSVSWDPMTLFVAVQSSNKEISIWRRSPPLPPGSPMKWTFKRVMYTEHFSEKSNTDVLGGSRLSWAPNGKNVVFPNSCFNNHNFSTCYQIQHNTTSFSHLFTKSNFDKNQAQYHFDTIDHPIDLEPVLLKGHNSRIRNVRFSNDIMKSNHNDTLTQVNEKYLLLAQSSDDNMLSIWRFKVNQECIISVECICVLKNLLDEQSSIEDLAWGDFGRCLAVASSQGGLILIQFNYEEIGSKFYTNRIQGLNLNEMNQPPYEFFDYSEYVNSLAEDPNDSSKQNTDINHKTGIKHKTMSNISQNTYCNNINKKCINKKYENNINKTYTNKQYENKDLNLGKIENIIVPYIYQNTNNNNNNKDNYDINKINDLNLVNNYYINKNDYYNYSLDNFYNYKDFMREFLIFCYRIYLISIFWKMKCDWNLFKKVKRQLNIENMYNITFYNIFYLFNFTIEQDNKLNQTKKKYKPNKKPKINPVLPDCITDIWLDMDYGTGNTIISRYWNDTEQIIENNIKENDVICEDNILNNTYNVSNQDIDVTPSKVDKPSKVTRITKSDKTKINKLGSTTSSNNMFEYININGLNDLNENLLSYPVLKQSISVSSNDDRKYLVVNFLNNNGSRTFTSSLTCIDECEFKVYWIHYLKKGYVTHIEICLDYLVGISQKLEGYPKSYLTILNNNNGEVYIDEVELGLNTISIFNLLIWNNIYFVLVTNNMLFGLFRYEYPKTITQILKFDLSDSPRDNILKMEVVNSTLNYRTIYEQKLREYKDNRDKEVYGEVGKDNKDEYDDEYVKKHKKKEKTQLNVKNMFENKHNDNSIENLVLVLYKKNKNVSIYSREYKELELNLELLNNTNKSLYSENNNLFNIDRIFRFYNNNSLNMYNMFSQVEFDGTLSKVIKSFTEELQKSNNINEDKLREFKDNREDDNGEEGYSKDYDNEEKMRLKNILKMKLKVYLLIGSVWEYMLHLYEYVKALFQIPELQEIIEFTTEMYKTVLRLMNESEDKQYQMKYQIKSQMKCDEIKVYDIGNYYKLIPHCMLLMRSVVIPNLNCLYRKFQEDLGMNLESFEVFETFENKSKCLFGVDNKLLGKFTTSLEYQDDEKKEYLEVS